MHPGVLEPAFVLHRRPYGDTSLLVELFSESRGRVAAIARGALAGKRRRGADLQPFVPLFVGWRGRGELQTLTDMDAAGHPIALRGEALYCGLYMNELMMRLCQREDPHPALFAGYGAALQALAQDASPRDEVLRHFELALLEELGLIADWSCTPDGVAVERRERYRIDPDSGPVAVTENAGGTVSGATLLDLASRAPLDTQGRREARDLMRRVLARQLGDKPLKSRELFKPMTGKK